MIHSEAISSSLEGVDSERVKSRYMEKIQQAAKRANIRLSENDILEAGFLPQNLPAEVRTLIIQFRKAVESLKQLEDLFSKDP
jgi:hypothetical protein